jgi:hypothetical protein
MINQTFKKLLIINNLQILLMYSVKRKEDKQDYKNFSFLLKNWKFISKDP